MPYYRNRYLIHFTKDRYTQEPGTSQETVPALKVLGKILCENKLHGSTTLILGSHTCVSFADLSLCEVVADYQRSEGGIFSKMNLKPYGIGIRKDWLFEQGARPVIYQPKRDFYKLPEELRFRHVTMTLSTDEEKAARKEDTTDIFEMPFAPIDVDHSCEKEWRIETETLDIRGQVAFVIVETVSDAERLRGIVRDDPFLDCELQVFPLELCF